MCEVFFLSSMVAYGIWRGAIMRYREIGNITFKSISIRKVMLEILYYYTIIFVVRNRGWKCMINVGGEVCICCTLVWGYELESSYVPCSHLRLLWARRFIVGVHACWTASGQVRKVGLQVGRSVELDYERVGSWKHDNP